MEKQTSVIVCFLLLSSSINISEQSCGEKDLGEDYKRVVLNKHNEYRAVHGASKLTRTSELDDQAQKYAAKIACTNKLEHSSWDERGRAGENLYMACSRRFSEINSGAAPVEMWYNKVCKPGYHFNVGASTGTDEFAQVVWKASKSLGVGGVLVNRHGSECIYVVARYKEAGCIRGKYHDNVVKGRFRDSYCT